MSHLRDFYDFMGYINVNEYYSYLDTSYKEYEVGDWSGLSYE